jgi:hypothetical protein
MRLQIEAYLEDSGWDGHRVENYGSSCSPHKQGQVNPHKKYGRRVLIR